MFLVSNEIIDHCFMDLATTLLLSEEEAESESVLRIIKTNEFLRNSSQLLLIQNALKIQQNAILKPNQYLVSDNISEQKKIALSINYLRNYYESIIRYISIMRISARQYIKWKKTSDQHISIFLESFEDIRFNSLFFIFTDISNFHTFFGSQRFNYFWRRYYDNEKTIQYPLPRVIRELKLIPWDTKTQLNNSKVRTEPNFINNFIQFVFSSTDLIDFVFRRYDSYIQVEGPNQSVIDQQSYLRRYFNPIFSRIKFISNLYSIPEDYEKNNILYIPDKEDVYIESICIPNKEVIQAFHVFYKYIRTGEGDKILTENREIVSNKYYEYLETKIKNVSKHSVFNIEQNYFRFYQFFKSTFGLSSLFSMKVLISLSAFVSDTKAYDIYQRTISLDENMDIYESLLRSSNLLEMGTKKDHPKKINILKLNELFKVKKDVTKEEIRRLPGFERREVGKGAMIASLDEMLTNFEKNFENANVSYSLSMEPASIPNIFYLNAYFTESNEKGGSIRGYIPEDELGNIGFKLKMDLINNSISEEYQILGLVCYKNESENTDRIKKPKHHFFTYLRSPLHDLWYLMDNLETPTLIGPLNFHNSANTIVKDPTVLQRVHPIKIHSANNVIGVWYIKSSIADMYFNHVAMHK